MKLLPTVSLRRFINVSLIVSTVLCSLPPSVAAAGAGESALVDDFSDAGRTHGGAPRILVTDKDAGSQSQATQTCEHGVLSVTGELVPGRGVPAFISVPLLLSADMQARDLSGFEGVRLRVKIAKGILIVQVASAEIQNFDFHGSEPVAAPRGEFHEVRLPFKTLKRGWSEQVPLNLKTITSVNLVAFGMAREAFAYEVDEIGFY